MRQALRRAAWSSFVAPVLARTTRSVEQTLRPRRLDEFVGQERVKEQLEIALVAAKARGEALDHVLLAGRRASARRSLAHIVREELGVGIRTIAGPAVEKKDIAAILTALEPRDVLFVDEIHRMSRTAEEILYPALEDFRIDIVMGEGAGARTLTLDLPPFTLVGATTRTGLLTTPLRDRFGMTFRLDYYDAGELARDRRTARARILGVEIAADAAEEIARRARGTPRIANRILRRVRDVAEVRHQGSITTEIAREALELLEIDEQGLDREARELLRAIAEKFDGGPVGLSTLAASLGEEPETIEDVYEPYLLQLGFIQRTPRGRTITKLGRAHIGRPRRAGPRSTAASEPAALDARRRSRTRRSSSGIHRAIARLRRGDERRRDAGSSRSSSRTRRASSLDAHRARAGLRDGDAPRRRRGDDAPTRLIVPIGSLRRIELRKSPEERVKRFGFSVPPAT